ncbi:hypothetical protein [Flavobacterium sp.]|uniref:hypothetical protein n=1 Tax=Flavobacterium sp. TaxID=239 RepID=UPI003B9C7715
MKIDIDQSIKRKKLVFKRTLSEKVVYLVFDMFFVFIVPMLSIYLIFYGNQVFNLKGILFMFLVNIPFVWGIIGLRFLNELTYLGEIDLNDKASHLSELKFTGKYQQVVEKENLVIMRKNDFWLQGKELILVFDGKKVYGNLTYLGKGDCRLSIFSFFTRRKLQKKIYC